MNGIDPFKPKHVDQKDAQSVIELIATDPDSWESVHIKDFGAIQLFDGERIPIAWVWLHDRETVPETYVFPYNGRVEMHLSVSLQAVLIDMLKSKMTDLYFSIEKQDAYLTVQEVPATSDRRKKSGDARDVDRRNTDQGQNVVQISQERRIVDRRRSG